MQGKKEKRGEKMRVYQKNGGAATFFYSKVIITQCAMLPSKSYPHMTYGLVSCSRHCSLYLSRKNIKDDQIEGAMAIKRSIEH